MTDEKTKAEPSGASGGSMANYSAIPNSCLRGSTVEQRFCEPPVAGSTPAAGLYVQWIPVTERLPKEYETVLVVTDGGVSAGEVRFPFADCGMEDPWWMVFKDRRDRVATTWAGFVRLSDVTHWMPLPAPPTDRN